MCYVQRHLVAEISARWLSCYQRSQREGGRETTCIDILPGVPAHPWSGLPSPLPTIRYGSAQRTLKNEDKPVG
jgi:hypothetical protein